MIEPERIEFDQQGTVGGMKVADRVYRLRLQQAKQLQHALMSFKIDLPAKRDEKGLIACGAEQRCSGCLFAHALLRAVLCAIPCDWGEYTARWARCGDRQASVARNSRDRTRRNRRDDEGNCQRRCGSNSRR